MQNTSVPPEHYLETAEKVRTGEYFREAKSMYDLHINDPMSERYLYVCITGLAVLIFLVAFLAMQALYPLSSPVPFIVNSNDIVEEYPRITTLRRTGGMPASQALLLFMTDNYTTFREEYDIDTFDRDLSGIKAQSAPEVFKAYQAFIDPKNPDSPIIQYQRHSKRKITILTTKLVPDQESEMEVVYEASVESKGDMKKSRWQANISFNYSGVELDEKGKVKPVTFVVTQYRTKRLQDIK